MTSINNNNVSLGLYNNGNDMIIDCIKFNYKNGKKKM